MISLLFSWWSFLNTIFLASWDLPLHFTHLLWKNKYTTLERLLFTWAAGQNTVGNTLGSFRGASVLLTVTRHEVRPSQVSVKGLPATRLRPSLPRSAWCSQTPGFSFALRLESFSA